MADAIFTARTAYDPTHPKALAVYCSDGRFTDAVEELLHSLGHARLDTLTMPGGPALLHMRAASYSDVDATSRAANFLIRGHGIQQIVLLAHDNCGYYRHRYPADRAEQVYTRQLDDLRESARVVARMGSQLGVLLYYARAEGNRVHFALVPAQVKR